MCYTNAAIVIVILLAVICYKRMLSLCVLTFFPDIYLLRQFPATYPAV